MDNNPNIFEMQSKQIHKPSLKVNSYYHLLNQ